MQAKTLIERLSHLQPDTEISFLAFGPRWAPSYGQIYLVASTEKKTSDGKPVIVVLMAVKGSPEKKKVVYKQLEPSLADWLGLPSKTK